MQIIKKKSSGLTLTELLISVAILGLLTSVVGTFLTNGIKFSRLSTAKGEIQRDARLCIDLVNKSLRQALTSTVVISRYNDSMPPCSMIEFTHVNGGDYRFYQLNDKFYTAVKPAGELTWNDHEAAASLRNLFFSYPRTDDSTIVSVSLCFEKATYEGSSKTLQLSVEKVRIMN